MARFFEREATDVMPEGNAKRPTTAPEGSEMLKPKDLKTLRRASRAPRTDVVSSLEKAEAVRPLAEPESEPMDAAELTREQDDGALFVERARERLADIERRPREDGGGDLRPKRALGLP